MPPLSPIELAAAIVWSIGAASTIPPAKCIEATVEGHLAAPATRPMHMPTDVAVDGRGRVFVADGANDRIVRFAPDGSFAGEITAPGGRRLDRPVGLTVDGADRLWIAESGKHRLVVLDSEGNLHQTIPLPEASKGHPCEPTDVAVASDGRHAYVVDNNNHRLLIRDNRTGKLTVIGRFGRGLGQFQWPFLLTLDSHGYAYVSEAIGARVQCIAPTGRLAGRVARWGVQLGQLYRPKGVAIDSAGRLYVSDSTLRCIQVFGTLGGLKGILTGPDSRPVRFDHPMGLCFDAKGRLYVVELGAGRVAVVSLASPATPPGRPKAASGRGGGRR